MYLKPVETGNLQSQWRIQIQAAQKHMDSPVPDSQHWKNINATNNHITTSPPLV
jgi:hypothetical protein